MSEQDHAIPAAGQTWMADRAGATISTVNSSHAVMVSHPEAVSTTVIEAVGAMVN